jgi:hypothetical protein
VQLCWGKNPIWWAKPTCFDFSSSNLVS